MEITNNISADMMANEAYANIVTRTSVRQYSDDPVSEEQISAILHAAMSAPSGVNRQPWEFIVVDERDLLSALSEALPYAKMTANARFAIIVCGNKERFLEGVDENLWEQDCSAASENILLAAHALELGAVWTCLYPHADRMESVSRILNIPENIVPFNLIPIGHPLHNHPAMNKWHGDRIHINGFS
ncbi:MAG: nitroreductase family protein [Muribaculaceae bacterium]|nr:nitroreductase family protein [Muribaculaceae bacterium]